MKNFENTPAPKVHELFNNFFAVLGEQDESKLENATKEFSEGIADFMQAEAKSVTTELYSAMQDNQIMVNRGARRAITSAEMKFFNEAVEKQKIDGLDHVLPTTIIETIMTDLAKEHPILSAIDTRYTEGVIKYIYGDPAEETAYWSEIPADIRQILIGAFKTLDLSVSKLSGFIALPKGYFQLGPTWLANYVTTFLREVMQATLETAVVNGDGKLKPIGMMRKLSGAVDGVYPEKTAVAINDLSPLSLAGPRALLAQEKMLNGRIDFIVNPATNEAVVNPNLFFQNTVDGSWKQLPLPNSENVITSYAVPEGKAILGNAKNYILAVAGNLEITKYTETLAIEDMDLYVAKMFATGVAKNANAFVVLDLSGIDGVTVPTADDAPTVTKQDTFSPAVAEETPEG